MSEDFDFSRRPDRYVAVAPVRRGRRKWLGPWIVRLHIDGWNIPVCERPSMLDALDRADKLMGRFGTDSEVVLFEQW